MFGSVQLTLLGCLTISLLAFGFLILLKSPAQAFVTKGASCSASSCHGAANGSAAISVALNGTQGTSITVAAGSTFEVDWIYTNMLYNASRYSGTNPEIATPTGWSVARGTANSPSLTGWSSTWNATGGVASGWNTTYSTATEFPNSPVGYSIDYTGTSWDNGSRNAAFDDASTGDLDGVANKMGGDARITVPAGTTPGTYTIMVLGIGHDSGNNKAHVEQSITVTVPDTTPPTVNTFTMPATASSLTVSVTAFTAADNVAVTGYKITESATAPLPGDAGWSGTAPTSFTFGSGGAKTAYAWAKDAAGYVSTSRSATVTITIKQDQTITVGTPAPASADYNSQFTVAATASSGLPVSYSSGSTGICTNSGATFTMVSGTGTCIVRYDQAGDASYNAAPQVTNNVAAGKINQSTVNIAAPGSAYYGQTGLSATASGGSGSGAYSYSAGSSTACTVNTATGALTITSGTGSCAITATRAADSNYDISAPSSPATVGINKATQATLTVTGPASVTYGSTGQIITSGGSGGGTMSYSHGTSTGCTVAAATGVITVASVSGNCSVTATKDTDSNYAAATSASYNVALNKANASVTTWPTAGAIIYGQTLASATLSGGASNPAGSFAFTAPATVPNAGTAPQGVTFTPSDTANYNNASGSVSVAVAKADPAVSTWPTAGAIIYGQTLASATLTGGSSNPAGTFAFTTPATVPNAGTAPQGVTFTPSDTANYNNASGSVNVAVDKASQSIGTVTFTPASLVVSGTAAASAAATSGLAVSFNSTTPAICTVDGNTVTGVSAGECSITVSQAGDSNYNAAADVIQPLTITGGSNPVLKVNISGNGSVNSNPSGIACTSGTCTDDTHFTNNQSVDLTASIPWNVDFLGWTGACSGTANPCTVVVNSLTEVTALFMPKQLSKIGPNFYASLQDAYNAAGDGAELLGRDDIFYENLVFDRAVNVAFTGGNNASWTVVGKTTISGTVSLVGSAGGSVTISNMIIQ
jgi:hypothetical protein